MHTPRDPRSGQLLTPCGAYRRQQPGSRGQARPVVHRLGCCQRPCQASRWTRMESPRLPHSLLGERDQQRRINSDALFMMHALMQSRLTVSADQINDLMAISSCSCVGGIMRLSHRFLHRFQQRVQLHPGSPCSCSADGGHTADRLPDAASQCRAIQHYHPSNSSQP